MLKKAGVMILLLSLFLFACQPQEKANAQVEQAPIEQQPSEAQQATKEALQEDIGQQPEAAQKTLQVPDEIAQAITTEEIPIQPEKSKEQEFQLIYPQLTYDGAYNGPLYATSEQIGSADMDSYFEALDRNGINFFIGMFGISGEPEAETLVSDSGLGEVIAAAQKHPKRIVPFFNPGIGGEEVEQYLGEKWLGWYTTTLYASKSIAGHDFIRGFGEIETQEWKARHNDPRIIQLVDVAKENEIGFMFHPVAGKIDDVQKIIEAYPETTFLIHLYREDLAKSRDKLITMLKEHDNLYFSMDAAHIIHVNNMDIIYDYDSGNSKSSISKFVSTYNSKEKSLVADAIKAYKPLVDAAPDKVMWGTEIGPEYAFHAQVFDRAIKASRLVIAGFDPEHQEAVGYRNALRVFGEGVVADPTIKVIDTGSWKDCTDGQMSDCDGSCDIPDSDVLTPEQDACFYSCIIKKQCREVVEMDTG